MADESSLDVKQFLAGVDNREEEFVELIDKIEYATPETKKLWREIYHNAADDRANAYMLFVDLYQHVSNNQQGHLNHGKQLAIYMERMNKSNDQLLKLAELIDAAKTETDAIDADALYDEFTTNFKAK